MTDFSMKLNEDQLTLQKWVHDFAENVVRPAGEEWDEKEEFPYPIVEQAKEIGLYSWEFMAEAMMNDPTGLSMPIASKSCSGATQASVWRIMGSGLAAAGIASSATPEQLMEWVPQCYENADTGKLPSARSALQSLTPDLTSVATAHRPSTTRRPTSGSSTAPRRGLPTVASLTFMSSSPSSIPSWDRKGTHRSSSHPGPRVVAGPESTKSTASGQPHRRGGPRRRACPGRCLLGGKEKLDERIARVRRGEEGNSQAAMQTFEATRPAVGAQALGVARAASSTHSSTRRSARRSVARSS